MNNDNELATNLNVHDHLKHLTVGQIKNIVKEKSFPFAVLMSQIYGDFNFSSVVRSANGLGASEVFYYGKRQWDRRGSLGVQNYTDIKFLHTFEDIKALKSKYSFVALENNIDRPRTSLFDFVWPRNSLICIGEEKDGLLKQFLDICDYYVSIDMSAGSIRSFNAAVAGSVAMYDYRSKFKG